MADRVLLTIGTKKGVFVAEAAGPRRRFELRGPFGPGVPVYSTLIYTRGTPRLYASSCNPFFGMKVLRSTDMGKSFKETKSAPAFPKDDGRALANIWSLAPGGDKFTACNKGVGAGFAPDPYPEFGQCVHKIARHDDAPGRLYMQNHGGWSEWTGPGGPRPDIGVLRSDDHGHSWRSIAKGLPSDFGFPIVVHPHDPDVVYVMPLEPATRTCPGGEPAVWRSENGGD